MTYRNYRDGAVAPSDVGRSAIQPRVVHDNWLFATPRDSSLPLTTGVNADVSPFARLSEGDLIELSSVTADTLKVLFPADSALSLSSSRP